MPHREFLETYPLYRKFETNIPSTANKLLTPAINMACPTCGANETFNQANNFFELGGYVNVPIENTTLRALYQCTSCRVQKRVFYIHFGVGLNWMMKVGQYPAWEIKSDPKLLKFLGGHAAEYKKGLVCESQGYGIGAYAYYRRIVEEKIDELLQAVDEIVPESEREEFEAALEQVKKTIVAQEKIAIVKDLLPASLRPDEMNPLGILHGVLSEGLHAKPDEECMEQAQTIREVLGFFVQQILMVNENSRQFTEGMRKLLSKRGKSGAD